MKLKLVIVATVVSLGAGILYVNAADNVMNHADHAAHGDHAAMMQQTQLPADGVAMQDMPIVSMPTEGGQGAFTAIAEIVELLNRDPNTDWSKVDITSLRNHLVDMNELALYAQAVQSEADGVVKFVISGKASALNAAKNMVPAHAVELNKMAGWQVAVTVEALQVTMLVSTDDEATLAKVKALGFFGMMATGAHHQPHHWGMATGAMSGHAQGQNHSH